MKKILQPIQKILSENLLSAYSYPKYPKETLVLIVKKNPLNALQLIKNEVSQIPIICLSQEEVEKGADVFSLQFFAIKNTAELLFGTDIFATISIKNNDLRRSIEYDIRNKNIYLRQETLRFPAQKVLPHIIPELIPVLLGISFLHENFQTDIEKLLSPKTFPKLNIEPLIELHQKTEYSECEALNMCKNISEMLEQWAEVID